ncbi:unnamed protein product [Closterium sp. NIES-53]
MWLPVCGAEAYIQSAMSHSHLLHSTSSPSHSFPPPPPLFIALPYTARPPLALPCLSSPFILWSHSFPHPPLPLQSGLLGLPSSCWACPPSAHTHWQLSSSARPLVKKKAALCLLRLFRKNPDIISTDTWPQRMASLLEERSLSVLLAAMSLLVALVAANPEAYLCCVPKCVKVLERLAKCVDISQDYTYYAIPSPWLQVKTMRVLQYFPSIEDPSIRKSLLEVLARILQGTEVVKNVNKNNAAHAILFEALALAMHMDAEREVMAHCVGLLGKFLGVREPNIRYLALENMARMLMVADVQDDIRGFQSQIVHSLKDPDISIRRRALDLLYGLCDTDNAKFIVEQLLQYLTVADFVMREELTLKTAILAEKFAVDLPW